ncbi:MAG TPA: arylesterase [Longimicrobiaceae bacterium]|nr:arylesterase [Longimicrobiaceae bacterium]
MRSSFVGAWPVLLLSVLMIGCRERPRNGATAPAAAGDSAAAAPAPPRHNVLFVGTSLTAGLGLPPDEAYPALVQAKIDSAGLPFHVINAGVSGETSAGALRRLDWLLRQPFDVLVLETGANDMLRGQDVDSTRANVQAIVQRVRRERPDARLVLVGMLALPNLGRDYAAHFDRIYPELAARDDLVLIPFLLKGVAGEPSLNQADGVHPNEKGARIVAQNVWTVLAPVLRREVASDSITPPKP